jgi:hypothetical protein
MAAETSIILGTAFTAAIFLYSAFQLRDSPLESNQIFAVFLAFVGLAFTNILFYMTYQIAASEAPYLIGGVLEAGLLTMIWTTNILLFYLITAGVWGLIKTVFINVPKYFKGAKD